MSQLGSIKHKTSHLYHGVLIRLACRSLSRWLLGEEIHIGGAP